MKKRWLFILGCERSGSTLVSTVLGLHNDTEFYFEPFSTVSNAAFKEWSTRYQEVEPSIAASEEIIQRMHETHAKRNEWLLFYWNNLLFRLYFSFRIVVSKILRGKLTRTFFHLNNYRYYNRLSYVKSRVRPVGVIKELRINMKWNLIGSTFLNSSVLVSFRHPTLQAQSMLRMMSKGSLSELRTDLPFALQKMAEKYSVSIPEDLHSQLIVYLTVQYSILLEDLQKTSTKHLCVSVEGIGEAYTLNLKRVLEWASLSWSSHQDKLIGQLTGEEANNSPLGLQKKDGYHAKLISRGNSDEFLRDYQLIQTTADTLGIKAYAVLIGKTYY